MSSHFDAVIIGGGPAGSTAAILLARAGWSVALVEKQAFPRRKVCGERIATSNLPLLQLLGIGPVFDTLAGAPLRQVALLRGNASALVSLPAAGGQESRQWNRSMPRELLDLLLLQQAQQAGAELWQPWSLLSIEGGPGRWRCQVRSSEADVRTTLLAPVLIAAHGSWEALPSEPPSPRPAPSGSDLLAFKANFRGCSLPEGLLPVLALDGGYGGMVVSEAGVTTLACCVRRDRLVHLRQHQPLTSAGDAVEAWLRRQCSSVGRSLSGAQREGPWLAAGPIAPGIRLRANDTMFRIGNAAGEAHPILDDGISMALQSATLLCSRLLEGASTRRVPDTQQQAAIASDYAGQWRALFVPRLRLAAVMAHLAMRRTPAELLLGLAQAWPGLVTRGARWGSKQRHAINLAGLAPAPTTTADTLPTPLEHRVPQAVPPRSGIQSQAA